MEQNLKKRVYPASSRRKFLKTAGFGALLFTQRGLFAEQLVLTPAQTTGPYYPDRMPLDLDNDLIRINDNITPAVGQITWLNGAYSAVMAPLCVTLWLESGKPTTMAHTFIRGVRSRTGMRIFRDTASS